MRLGWFDDECGRRDQYPCLGSDGFRVGCCARTLQVRERLLGEQFVNRRCGSEVSAGKARLARRLCLGCGVVVSVHAGWLNSGDDATLLVLASTMFFTATRANRTSIDSQRTLPEADVSHVNAIYTFIILVGPQISDENILFLFVTKESVL